MEEKCRINWWKMKKYSYDDNFRDDEVEDLENGKNVDNDDDDDV